ncbi:hypothetical protein ACFLRY_05020 [Bacteroidota bacterium]
MKVLSSTLTWLFGLIIWGLALTVFGLIYLFQALYHRVFPVSEYV